MRLSRDYKERERELLMKRLINLEAEQPGATCVCCCCVVCVFLIDGRLMGVHFGSNYDIP